MLTESAARGHAFLQAPAGPNVGPVVAPQDAATDQAILTSPQECAIVFTIAVSLTRLEHERVDAQAVEAADERGEAAHLGTPLVAGGLDTGESAVGSHPALVSLAA